MKILVLNAGSSSQKCSLYELGSELSKNPVSPFWEGQIDWTHQADRAELTVTTAQAKLTQTLAVESPKRGLQALLDTLWHGSTAVLSDLSEIKAVGHRVVHGGIEFHQSVVITPEVKAKIQELASFAPLHNPANLAGIVAVDEILGSDLPQVAVFDTAFHATIPLSAAIYPGPYEWVEQGIRRYGFHGTSHQYCAERAAVLLGKDLATLNLIICHLGNGCSLCAVRDGQSVETTMGFTPLEGLMMGTRAGSVDPGILIHLQRQQGYSPDDLERILNRESGLLGISGLTADMRGIREAIDQNNPRAILAFEIFIHRLRAGIAALLPSLGNLDALIFTAGIGEHSAVVRSAVIAGFEWLGWALDPVVNEGSPADHRISAEGSSLPIWILHTQENWMIAQACWQLLS